MLSIGPRTKVFLRPGATDLRLGYEGLSQLARTGLGQDPQSGHVFAFCNHSRTRLKLLLHDGSGLWLCSKRLDSGGFTWPADGPADPLTAAQLWALIAGLEVSGWKKHWRR
jgi:transposase